MHNQVRGLRATGDELTPAQVAELRSMIAAIDKIFPFVFAIPESERSRSIIADDMQFDGSLLSPAAFASIRGGSVSHFLVDSDFVALDGRKIREFAPIYLRVIERLNLKSDDGPFSAERPVLEFTAVDVNDSLDILSDARNELILRLPPLEQEKLAKKRSLWPWLLAGAGLIFLKSQV